MSFALVLDNAPAPASPVEAQGFSAAEVEPYLPLVRKVVNMVARHLPSHVDKDDLRSVGLFGLLSALRKYDPAQGNRFEAYAMTRIRGAILDELRRMDCMPRTARAKVRKLHEAVEVLEQRFGRAPSDDEIQSELGLDNEAFKRMKRQTRPVTFLSLDSGPSSHQGEDIDLHEAIPDEQQRPGYVDVQGQELNHLLAEHLHKLPERQQRILFMSFYEERCLSDIAEVFGVSEARICQIRAQALGQLRKRLQGAACA